MWCHPFAHLAHEPTCGGGEIGTFRGYFPGACMARSGGTDVGYSGFGRKHRKPFRGLPGVDRASGLYCAGNTRVGRRPVSSHGSFSRSRSSSRSVPRHGLDSSLVRRRHHRHGVSRSLLALLRIPQTHASSRSWRHGIGRGPRSASSRRSTSSLPRRASILSATRWPASTGIILITHIVLRITYRRPSSRRRTTTSSASSTASTTWASRSSRASAS